MGRRLLNFLTFLSLLLCAAVVTLWVRSYFAGDDTGWHSWTYDRTRPENDEKRTVGIATCDGIIIVGDIRVLLYAPLAEPVVGSSYFFLNGHHSERSPLLCADPPPELHGFAVFRGEVAPTQRFVGVRGWAVTSPLWALALLTALRPAFWMRTKVISLRQSRRFARGLCIRCGYDLTGNMTGVCPECGAARFEDWLTQSSGRDKDSIQRAIQSDSRDR